MLAIQVFRNHSGELMSPYTRIGRIDSTAAGCWPVAKPCDQVYSALPRYFARIGYNGPPAPASIPRVGALTPGHAGPPVWYYRSQRIEGGPRKEPVNHRQGHKQTPRY